MTQTKKMALEQSGWSTGSVADFLKFSEDEASIIEMRVHLLADSLPECEEGCVSGGVDDD